MPRVLRATILVLTLALCVPTGAAAEVTTRTIDGPSADIVADQYQLDVAGDESAAVVYLKKVGGVNHIFAATYSGGQWSAPQRLDEGLAAASSFPDVGVGNGGRVVATFLNDGRVYSSVKPSAGEPFQLRAIVDPGFTQFKRLSVDMDDSGVAYAAYIDPNFHLRASRLDGTTWSAVDDVYPNAGGVLNNNSLKQVKPDYGVSPSVAGDGSAAIAWSEPEGAANVEQVFVRRVSGTNGGAVHKASIDVLGGRARGAFADMTDLDADAQGSHVVVFREFFTYGASEEPRLIARRLNAAGVLGEPQVIDGLPEEVASGGEFPLVDVNAPGEVLAGQLRQEIDETVGASETAGAWSAFELDPDIRSRSVPAFGDVGIGAFAWSRGPGGVIGRLWDKGALGEPFMLSRPEFGPGSEPRAGADAIGNVTTAFAQGGATDLRIVVARSEAPRPVVEPPPGDPGSTGDADGPELQGFGVRPKRLKLGRRLPRLLLPGQARRSRQLRFTVSEASGIRVSFARRRGGRFVAVRGLLRVAVPEGASRVRFQGRLSRRRALRPGRYRASAVAVDPAGNRSQPVRARFRLLRR